MIHLDGLQIIVYIYIPFVRGLNVWKGIQVLIKKIHWFIKELSNFNGDLTISVKQCTFFQEPHPA